MFTIAEGMFTEGMFTDRSVYQRKYQDYQVQDIKLGRSEEFFDRVVWTGRLNWSRQQLHTFETVATEDVFLAADFFGRRGT